MKNKKLYNLPDAIFRRRTGVKKKEDEKNKSKGGRPKKLSAEDKLLMILEYLREYRTYFHIAQSYKVAESVCYENIKEIEDILIKSKKFSLPKRKEVLMSEDKIEIEEKDLD